MRDYKKYERLVEMGSGVYQKKRVIKVALACAVLVGSVAFSSPVSAIDIRTDTQLINENNYTSNSTLNIMNNIANIGTNLPSISNVTNLIIQGNNGTNYTVSSRDEDFNYGYQISNSSLNINNLTFNNWCNMRESGDWNFGSLRGAGLDISGNSTINLNNVSFNGNSLIATSATAIFFDINLHAYGGAVSNQDNSTSNIVGGTFTGNSATTKRGLANSSGNALGGAIYNTGKIDINEATFSKNYTSSETSNSYGGAIYNSGTLDLTNTTMQENHADAGGTSANALGGAIYTSNGVTLHGGNKFSGNYDEFGANDIYLAGGNLNVDGDGSSNADEISSGLASANANSNIVLTNGGKLILNGDNSRFQGNALVGSDSKLTYGGSSQSVINGTTTVTAEGGIVEFDLNSDVKLAGGKILTSQNVEGQFIKSGEYNLNLDNGDYFGFSGDVIVQGGALNYSGTRYLNASSNTITTGAILNYTNNSNDTIKNIQGEGEFNKDGNGSLTIDGTSNNQFIGTANINSGSLVYNGTDGDTFFSNDATVNLNGSKLDYTAPSTTLPVNLDNNSISHINLNDGATFSYTATGGTTNIYDSFFTSNDGNNSFVFNGNSQSDFILQENFSKEGTGTDTLTFSDTNLALGQGLYDVTNNIVLDNASLDVMDSEIKNYTFSNLVADNANLKIDISLGSNLASDTMTINSGHGILNISDINITADNGLLADTDKTVQVIYNKGESTVSLIDSSSVDTNVDAKLAAWSTNVYTYDINASKSNDANSYYDSLTFDAVSAANPDSLKAMNNYEIEQIRGFSHVTEGIYNIARDLGQTKQGTFTVNGISKDTSIISGQRVLFTIDNTGNITYSQELTDEHGSFFELTDTRGPVELNLENITFTGADRTEQDIKDGSILNSNIANATVNVNNAGFTNSHASGNGGAFAIFDANKVTINDSTFSGNKADGNGGAIYTQKDLNISNSSFSNNTDRSGKNDITIANNANIIFNVDTDKKGELLSGIKSADGTGTLTKTGQGTLNISGHNSGFNGNVNINEGKVIYDSTDNNDSFFGYNDSSNIAIGEDAFLVINNDKNANLAVANLTGNGNIEIDGNLTLTGKNSGFTGDILINSGITSFEKNEATSFFGGNTNLLGQLNYTTTIQDSIRNLSGNGILNKYGEEELTLSNYTFNGTVNVMDGTLNAVSSTSNATDLDFSANIYADSTLNYQAGAGTTLTLDNNDKLKFNAENTNATFEVSNANIILGTIANETGNNLIINNADNITLSRTSFGGDYTVNNSYLNLMDRQTNDYSFESLSSNNSKLSIDISLAENPASDTITVNGGSGIFDISNLGITHDNGNGQNKTVQIIYNSNGSTLSLLDPESSSTEIDPALAAWSTNVYEYDILATQSQGSTLYDSLQFVAKQAANPESLKTMNNYEIEQTRGFSLVTGAGTYNIARDLEQTKQGIFTVNGISMDTSLISGQRVKYDINNDGTITYHKDSSGNYILTDEHGSFFELTDTRGPVELNLENITFTGADRTEQDIKDGSILYSNIANATVNVNNAGFTNSHASGNGGAFAIFDANKVTINDSTFSGNKADGNGGAIYTQKDLNISNSSFSNNTDRSGKNDITIANNANIIFNVDTDKKGELLSGIKSADGTGTLTKTGQGTLNISGHNSGFNGNVNINEGKVIYDSTDNNDSFFGYSDSSNITIGSGTSLEINNTADANLAAGHFAGNGGLYINGDMTLLGNNSTYTGIAKLDDADLKYITQADNDTILGGEIQLTNGSSISTDETSELNYKGGNFSSDSNNSTFNKNDKGEFTLTGDNAGFIGNVNLNNGTTSFEKNEATSFFGGNTNLLGQLNYTTTIQDSIRNLSGNGILNKYGEEELTLSNYTFNGTVNVMDGTLNAVSSTSNATDLDFSANIYADSTLNYQAGAGTTLTLDNNDKLKFNAENTNATFEVSNANIILGTIANETGNNLIINNADNITLSKTSFGGDYTVNNSTINIMDGTTSNYSFENLSANDSNIMLDVSLGENKRSDLFTANSGSGVVNISNLAIIDDNGDGQNKTVQVINNAAGSSLSLAAPASSSDILAEWSTNVYEYNILAAQSAGTEGSAIYDSLRFEAQKAASPQSLRDMNQYEGLRGFSQVTNDVYHIAQDLDTTKAGTFTVNGAGRDNVISGQRVKYTFDEKDNIIYQIENGEYVLSDEKGSFFELLNETDLTIKDLTIRDANRENQQIKDGSVLYLAKDDASVKINNVLLTENSSIGNGGAIAALDGNLNITGSDFTNNVASGLGGAIYADTNITISDTNFANNIDKNGSNDIYVTAKNTVEIVSNTKESNISSGVAGEGMISITGANNLNLSGKNDEFNGILDVSIAKGDDENNEKGLHFIQNSTNDSYISGVTNIAENSKVSITNDIADLNIAGTFSGQGNLEINAGQDKGVILNGDNSALSGRIDINSGKLFVNMDSDDDKYISGITNIKRGTNLTFDVQSGLEKEIISNTSQFYGYGEFEKDGEGTLSLQGNFANLFGTVEVTDGVLEYAQTGIEHEGFGNIINTINISDKGTFRVSNQLANKSTIIHNINGEGIFEVDSIENSVVELDGVNAGFDGLTLISNGNLEFTKDDTNSFVNGQINIDNANSNLTYSTDGTGETINSLTGIGSLTKDGNGELTVSMHEFTGDVNVNSGTLTVYADEQVQSGNFAFNSNIVGTAILNYIAGTTDVYNLNSDSAFKFNSINSGATVNFANGTYNIISDLTNATGNTTEFDSAVVNIVGSIDTALNGNYALNHSDLNLANGSITKNTINSLTASDTNLVLDFSFEGNGKFDTIVANDGDARLILNDDSLKLIDISSDSGAVGGIYNVLSGAQFASDYNGIIQSDIFKYTVSTEAGGSAITITASDYVGNTLYTLNHIRSGKRSFSLVGTSHEYYIGQALDTTLSGELNILGRDEKRSDTIIAKDNMGSSLSMFEVVKDNTVLNVKDVTIQDAHTQNSGSVILLNNDSSSVNVTNTTIQHNSSAQNGGAISVAHGDAKFDNVDFISNTSASSGGALNVTGGTTSIENSSFDGNSAENGGAIYSSVAGNSILEISNTSFSNNNAENGSAIYNLGDALLNNAKFSLNTGNSYIYNGSSANLTISATEDYTLANGNNTGIINNGNLYLNSTEGYSISVNDEITSSDTRNKGQIYSNGDININNKISDSIISVETGTMVLGNQSNTVVNDILSNVDMQIKENTTALLNNKNINEGTLAIDGEFDIANSLAIGITSDIKGSGVINKFNDGRLNLTDGNNREFNGILNVNNGKVVTNTLFSSDAIINVDASKSNFEYISNATSAEFNDSFEKINLTNGGSVAISGAGSEISRYTLSDGWLTSDGGNSIIFNNANYTLNSTYSNSIADNIEFNSSFVNLGEGINSASNIEHTEASDYNLGNNNFIFTDSTLNLSNRIAGDNYNFNGLNFNSDTNAISLDINLYLEKDDNEQITRAPYADTITANSGDGIVEINRLFITDDNGLFVTKNDGTQSKGVIQVFKGNNNLRVETADNIQILSWATNVYKYGIMSATKEHAQDSIEIIPKGNSHSDTLRDLNIYDPLNNGDGGNRGFSFIARDGLQKNNIYNIYRDLDTTSKGTFTVLGTISDDEGLKSILSGELTNLVTTAEDAGDKLTVDPSGQYIIYDNKTLYPDKDYVYNSETGEYTIYKTAFTSVEQTNGSMFEIVNNTDFLMQDVSVQNAKRYDSDEISDGSVIYADNKDAVISLDNVDFINNEVLAGNGGAIANINSSNFSLYESVISGNKASGDGGAIYNTSENISIIEATADNNISNGLGGAIYTNKNMLIADSKFGETAYNIHKDGKNDIYIDEDANVRFETSANTNESLINSGIAGSGTLTKTGIGTLNLSGNNQNFNGNLVIKTGSLTYMADETDDSFINGAVQIEKNGILNMNIASENQNQTVKNVLGEGSLNKLGEGILYLTGNNSKFVGNVNIEAGSVIYDALSIADSYFKGNTILADNTQLTTNIREGINNQIIENIAGSESASFVKQGSGELTLSGANQSFSGNTSVENGKLIYKADSNTDSYFRGTTTIADEAIFEANIALQDTEGNNISGQTIGNITGGSRSNFAKTGSGTLQLSGSNNSFTGTTTISEGILAYTAGNGTYVGGDTIISEKGTLEYTVNNMNDSLSDVSGEGVLTKLGNGTLNVIGDNHAFTGDVNIKEGILAYTSVENDNNELFDATAWAISEGASLYIDNGNDVNLNNVKGDENGSGDINKLGEGVLILGGDNSEFRGNLAINNGEVNFYKDENSSYIGGNTIITQQGALNFNISETLHDELINVSGAGVLNKYGNGTLTFDASKNNVEGSFIANANEGILNVTGMGQKEFDFNIFVNNSASLNYTGALNSEITINNSSKVGFGDSANSASIIFNSNSPATGKYILENDLKNADGNSITFNDTTIELATDSYNANYSIQNSIIDLINDSSQTKTFASLNTSDSKLKIDVDLTLPKPNSDKLIANSGSGSIELALNEINLNDATTDNGLGETYSLNVLGGNLTLSKKDSLEYWTTDVYSYKVDIEQGGQDINLTAIKAADNNSLKEMNNLGGNRGFQFHSKDDQPYIIGDNLGETAGGTFIVTGNRENATIISGEDEKSFFEVTNDTDITIKDLTITDAKSDNSGSALIISNDSSNVILDNVNITSSTSNSNGGAIHNTTSESLLINGGTITENLSKGGVGGAIYTEDDMTIIDTDFSANTDKNGKNDIYIEGEDTVLNIITQNKDVNISSGIAGDGTVNKIGSENLNLSGKNDNFTGTLNITGGNLEFTQSDASDTFISGNTSIGSESSVTIHNSYSNITSGSFSGEGILNKDGSADMTLSGDNSKFTGTTNINEGSITYNSDGSNKYFSGNTNINAGGTLIVNAEDNTSLSKISGSGNLDKNGEATLIIQGRNDFSGNLNINNGTFAIAAGGYIGNLANAKFADGTSINLQNTSIVDLGDGTYTTNPSPASIENLYFNSLTLNGDVDLNIDIDLKNTIADKVGAGKVFGSGNFIIDNNGLNVVSDALLNNTNVQIAYGDAINHIILSQNARTVMGPIQKYDVAYGGGNLLFTRQGGTTPDIDSVNPAVMASPVATQLGGYLTQLQTLNAGFYHMDRYTKYPYMLRLTAESSNKNAITEVPTYQKSALPETSNAMWVQPYTTFENIQLRGGIGVSNVAYGAMYGGDSDLVDLGHGYKGVLSTFIGYNGSHMSFNGISMNQQGGALGVTGTLYKGNFFTGLTVSSGASAGEAYTPYGTDNFAMLTAGIASKTGYNWEIKEGRLIVQPSLFLGYTFANTFDYTNAAGVKIDSDPLHAITVVPGIKLIGNLKNGWQPYAGVNMVWSIMDKTNVMANDVRLPQLSVKPYVEYGVGVQKSWGERFTAFFQTMLRNGGRTGVALTAGFRWAIGKDKPKNATPPKKKVIKTL